MSTLKQAIERAIEGGWSVFGHAKEPGFHWTLLPDARPDYLSVIWDKPLFGGEKRTYSRETIIFNHDFAKALWNKPDEQGFFHIDDRDISGYMAPWEYRLIQLAIAPDRLKYLEEYLNG